MKMRIIVASLLLVYIVLAQKPIPGGSSSGSGGGSSSLTIDTTPIGSGTDCGVLFQSSSKVSQSTSNGCISESSLSAPSAPSLTVLGTPGSTTRQYAVLGLGVIGHSPVGATATTTTSAATLNSTDKVRITVPSTGALFFDVYRLSPPSWLGVAAAGGTVDDTGQSLTGYIAGAQDTSTGFSANRIEARNLENGSYEGLAYASADALVRGAYVGGAPVGNTLGQNFLNAVEGIIGLTNSTTVNAKIVGLRSTVQTAYNDSTGNIAGGIFGTYNYAYHMGSGNLSGGLWGTYQDVEAASDSGSTIDKIGGAYIYLYSAANTVDNIYGVYVQGDGSYGPTNNWYGTYVTNAGGTITNAYGHWVGAMGGSATNPYSFWSDEEGVFRIKSDNSFDSVYQAIPAGYNPQFTKYVVGASNYERWFLRWNGNVAEIGAEAGGTGTLRPLKLLGSYITSDASFRPPSYFGSIVTATTTYSATATDFVILCDTSSSGFSINLPALSVANVDSRGQVLHIKKVSASNTCTLDGSGSETIDGATTLSFTDNNQSYTVVASSGGWKVI